MRVALYYLQTTCLVHTSWTIAESMTKVVSVGPVHNGNLFPTLQYERKSGKNVYEKISGAKPSCKVCMPEAASPVVCGCTICSSSHFLSTSFSGQLKASMHGRSTAAITRVTANFIIVSCRSRLVAMIVAAKNNAIGLSTFLFIS